MATAFAASPPPSASPPSAGEQLEGAVRGVRAAATAVEIELLGGRDPQAAVSHLQGWRQSLEAADAAVRARFDAIAAKIDTAALPAEVLQRHAAVVAEHEQSLGQLLQDLRTAEQLEQEREQALTADDTVLAGQRRGQLLERVRQIHDKAVDAERQGRPHMPLDPDKLPHRQAEPSTRAPRLDKQEFPEYQGSPQLAYNGELDGLMLAQAAVDLPTPADLAQTAEIQLTPGIDALATQLGRDPVAIFNYVRQNIRFVPTYGSIQGAEACRLSEQCNAFDTASLLIALLRASDIPARYAIGTLELDPDLFRSALGDFDDVVSAARLAASGGIPTVLVKDAAGTVGGVRMEHVWVEAYVDYVPGRGAAAGPGDTWVPLDAAIKRTVFTPPLPAAAVPGLDLQALRDDLIATGTVTNAGSAATGLSATLAGTRIDAFQTQIADYIATDLQDATVGELLGALDPHAGPVSVLPASLPGRILVVGGRTATLPVAARHGVSVRLLDRYGLSEHIRFDSTTVELAGQRVTLGYRAASSTDVATIESFGGLLQTPPYLVNLTPVLYVDGVAVAAGSPVRMGTIQTVRVEFREPDGRSDSVDHLVTAGTYAALGLDLQRVSESATAASRQRLEDLRAAVAAVPADSTSEAVVFAFDELMGEVLNLHALTYFLQVEATNQTTAHQLNVVAVKRPAEMLATFAPAFAYSLFGAPIEVTRTGMNVDVRRYVVSMASRTGDRAQERAYLVGTGTYASIAESAIFEEMQGAQAVSAVKLIAEANNRNIPIFSIDQTNAATMLPQLDVSSAALNDIRNAVAAGKQVITPQTELTYFDWTGLGYVVLDLATGAGAYLISGGLAGGGTADLSDLLSTLSNLFTVFGFLTGVAAIALTAAALGTGLVSALGLLLAAAGIIASAWYVYDQTGSILATVAAAVITTLAAVYLSAVLNALIWTVGLGTTVVAAVAFLFVVTVIVSAIVALLIYLLTLTSNMIEPLRRRWLARSDEDGGGGGPSWRLDLDLPLGLGHGVAAA